MSDTGDPGRAGEGAVVVVGAPSTGIRMGAAVVAAVAGVPVRFVNDWSEIND